MDAMYWIFTLLLFTAHAQDKKLDDLIEQIQINCDAELEPNLDSQECAPLLKKFKKKTGKNFDFENLDSNYGVKWNNSGESDKFIAFAEEFTNFMKGDTTSAVIVGQRDDIKSDFSPPNGGKRPQVKSSSCGDISYSPIENGLYQVYFHPYVFNIKQEIFDGMVVHNDFFKCLKIKNNKVYMIDDLGIDSPLDISGLKQLTPSDQKQGSTKEN